MFENIGIESLILGASVGAGLVGMAAALVMMRRSEPIRQTVDLSDLVRDAPYDGLHNVLAVRDSA